MDALRAVPCDHAIDLSAPDEPTRRVIGKQCNHIGKPLGPAKQAHGPLPGRPPGRAPQRESAADSAFRHVTFERDHAQQSVLAHAPGKLIDKRRPEAHTSELQTLMRNTYADFSWKQNMLHTTHHTITSR